MRVRVIPCLLLRGGGLYKTVRFGDARYVGDPVNAVRIFNDKEVDEIIVLDIAATPEQRGIAFDMVTDIASECFMPMCYGGGVRTMADLHALFNAGIEKVAINTRAVEDPALVRQAAEEFGSQSIVVSIDARRTRRGYTVCTRGGRNDAGVDPVDHARAMEEMGAGEIMLTSIDREGTGEGYDVDLVRRVSSAVQVPVVANGGAGTLQHFAEAVQQGGASGVAAGSMFVFHGRHRAVLINYPSSAERDRILAR